MKTPTQMKSAYFSDYGPIENVSVQSAEVPIPESNQILIKNHASSINFGNHAHIVGKPFFIRAAMGMQKTKYPIPGGDVAGVVAAVGSEITEFKVGDEVIADTADSGMGAYAEYVLATEKVTVKKPANLSFEEAASFPLAAGTAYAALQKAEVKSGQDVLIVGSTGGVGSFAVQIAKSMGAKVTAVCSGEKSDYVKGLGADKIIDYKTEDFSHHENKYDVVLGIAGYNSMSKYKAVLKPEGVYVNVGGSMDQFRDTAMVAPFVFAFSKKKAKMFMYMANKETLANIASLAESGAIRPVVDKVFALDNIVEALKYYESRQAKGKIVISID